MPLCEESIPFYRKLAALEKRTRSMPILSRVPRRFSGCPQLLETHASPVEAFPGIELNQVKVEGHSTLIW